MKMESPITEAAKVYRREPSSHTFLEALEYYLATGYVFSTPSFFVMTRPVSSSWPEQAIVNPMSLEDHGPLTGRLDCWHVSLMAGDLEAAWKLLPFPLPLTSFERRNKLRFYRHDQLDRYLRRPVL